jgi:hypothetical protein
MKGFVLMLVIADFLPGLMGLAAVLAVVVMMSRASKAMEKVCAALAVPVFVVGLACYTIGYTPAHPSAVQMVTAMLRGLLSAGRMFIADPDYGNFSDYPDKAAVTGDPVFQVILTLCHALSLMVSVAAVMGLLGNRVFGALRARVVRHRDYTIIVGGGDNARALGESVQLHGNREKADAARLVAYLAKDLPEETRKDLSGDALVQLYTEETLPQRMRALLRRAHPRRHGHTRLVLMPQTAKEGIAMLEACKTATKAEAGEQTPRVCIVSDEPALHDAAEAIGIPVVVRKTAQLAARRMIASAPPFSAIAFENGRATGDFSVLVVGFDHRGMTALRHLIMNGQFEGSRMRALVIDSQMEAHKGGFERA